MFFDLPVCTCAGAAALRIMNGADTGEILMTSAHGWYLLFGDELVLLCDEDKGRISFALEFADFEKHFGRARSLVGEYVRFRGGRLILPGANICIPRDILSASLPRPAKLSVLLSRDEELCRLVSDSGKGFMPKLLPYRDSIINAAPIWEPAPNDPVALRASQRLMAFFYALRSGRQESLTDALGKLLGLGPGLTPSTDDWVVGFLYAVRPYINPHLLNKICQAVCQSMVSATNRISAAYLECACEGGSFEIMEELLSAGNTEAAERLLFIGSSSGSDMLTGLLFAIKYIELLGGSK